MAIHNPPLYVAPRRGRTRRPRKMLGKENTTRDFLIFLAATATNTKVLLDPADKLRLQLTVAEANKVLSYMSMPHLASSKTIVSSSKCAFGENILPPVPQIVLASL